MTEAFCELPPREAVTVAARLAVFCAADTWKVVLADPGATVTVAGTVSAVLLLESATVPPPVPESVTVQVLN